MRMEVAVRSSVASNEQAMVGQFLWRSLHLEFRRML